ADVDRAGLELRGRDLERRGPRAGRAGVREARGPRARRRDHHVRRREPAADFTSIFTFEPATAANGAPPVSAFAVGPPSTFAFVGGTSTMRRSYSPSLPPSPETVSSYVADVVIRSALSAAPVPFVCTTAPGTGSPACVRASDIAVPFLPTRFT